MHSLTVPAPAKVNLFLHVTGRRADGYHVLESLMAPLDFGDTVSVVSRRMSLTRRAWKTGMASVPLEVVERLPARGAAPE